jgi:thiamine-phosphate pyrophosphorylase
MSLPRRRPLLCLVSDRTRLAGHGGTIPAADALVSLVGAAARAGVDVVQIRERDLSTRELFGLVARCLDAVRGTDTIVIVNDRADVALTAGAAGVHLRGDSIEAVRLRRWVPPGFVIGRSVHGEAEARDACARGGLDYLILGSVFETRSKAPGHQRLGLAAVARIAEQAPVPVLAIGGITLDRVSDVIRAGVAGIAAIGLFLGTADEDPAQPAARAVAAARGPMVK